ncbi:MAG: orotidine-5'-phosphate decarboxylase [Cyanobacteria bacterium P01_H01_bin.15]
MIHWGDHISRLGKEISQVALGVDPVAKNVPACFDPNGASGPWMLVYIETLLSAAKDIVGCIKFQSAFFEAFGTDGIATLARSISLAKEMGYCVILDAKRGDIGNTAEAYARAYLTPGVSDLEVDCMTVNPFLGPDSLQPFVDCSNNFGKGVFILAKNSNPGAVWLQDQKIESHPVSQRVGGLVDELGKKSIGASGLSCVGAVVGATFPEDGEILRRVMPNAIFLAPGIGAQGGKPEDIDVMSRADGGGIIVPVSRGALTLRPGDEINTKNDFSKLVSRNLNDIFKALNHR